MKKILLFILLIKFVFSEEIFKCYGECICNLSTYSVKCMNISVVPVLGNNDYIVNLTLSHNKITTIYNETFAGTTNLTNLYLDHNPITDIDTHAFSNNGKLRMLTLYNTLLKSLDFLYILAYKTYHQNTIFHRNLYVNIKHIPEFLINNQSASAISMLRKFETDSLICPYGKYLFKCPRFNSKDSIPNYYLWKKNESSTFNENVTFNLMSSLINSINSVSTMDNSTIGSSYKIIKNVENFNPFMSFDPFIIGAVVMSMIGIPVGLSFLLKKTKTVINYEENRRQNSNSPYKVTTELIKN